MKTFIFTQKNSGVSIVLSADDFDEAKNILEDHVQDTWGWRCEDPEGEEEY